MLVLVEDFAHKTHDCDYLNRIELLGYGSGVSWNVKTAWTKQTSVQADIYSLCYTRRAYLQGLVGLLRHDYLFFIIILSLI